MPNQFPTEGIDPRIEQIVAAILKIADMDFDTGLRPGTRRDEIDAIIMGINAMATELKLTYTTLDRRVEVRTIMLEKARDQMELLAYTDPLTQLANRSALMRDIDVALQDLEDGGTGTDPVAPRPGRLQEHQRHPRPCRRRPGACASSPPGFVPVSAPRT